MNFRTFLALEVRENCEGSRNDGVECTSFESAGAEITRLRVTDRRGEEILGKPRGEYITVQSQSFARSSRISDELIDAVAQELSRLLPSEGTVLAAGLGNTNITPDALGPKFIGGVFVTRHLKRELCEQLGLGRLRPVAAIAPGVLGQTGVETGELLLGAVLIAGYVLLMASFGLFVGLKMPNLHWTNEITPIKQGGAVMLALFTGCLLYTSDAADDLTRVDP